MISFRGIKSAPSLASCGCEEGLGGTSTVRQEIFLDVIAVGLEQHVGAAQLANLFFGPLDHAVALARLLIEDLARGGHFEALLGARFGLHLGHFALQVSPPAKPAVAIVTIALHFACLICGRALSPENRISTFRDHALEHFAAGHGSPYQPGGGRAGYGRADPSLQIFRAITGITSAAWRPRRPFHLCPMGERACPQTLIRRSRAIGSAPSAAR